MIAMEFERVLRLLEITMDANVLEKPWVGRQLETLLGDGWRPSTKSLAGLASIMQKMRPLRIFCQRPAQTSLGDID